MIEIPAPRRRDLAKYNKRDGLGFEKSQEALEEHTEHWAAERVRALQKGNMPAYDMASTILGVTVSFTEAWEETRRRPVNDRARERSRLTLLNAIALGTLLREQWRGGAASTLQGDPTEEGHANTVLDIYVDRGNPLDFRVHTPAIRTSEAPDEVWYRTDNLYVRQVRPIEPTDAVAKTLARQNIHIDTEVMETLYPYIPVHPFTE